MPQKTAPNADAQSEQSPVATFEKQMQELEQIVEQMEQGDLPLEDSLRLYERGTALARNCRSALDQAELKVQQLTDKADAPENGASVAD